MGKIIEVLPGTELGEAIRKSAMDRSTALGKEGNYKTQLFFDEIAVGLEVGDKGYSYNIHAPQGGNDMHGI